MTAISVREIPHHVYVPVAHTTVSYIKLALIAVFVGLTNFGFVERVDLLFENSRWTTLIPYLGVWTLALAALLAAAFQPRISARLLWAVPIAASSAFAYGYYRITQSDLSVHDMLSLWSARHEAGRAAEFYGAHLLPTVAVLGLGLIAITFPPAIASDRLEIWLRRAAWLPLLPVFAIGGIVYAKGGGGSQALPKQFAPLALTAVVAEKVATQGVHERRAVAWTPTGAGLPNIVMLVDESIRADYLDLAPGNKLTPSLATLAPKFVNFGPAVSGGDCSHYSNAILRFAASRRDLVKSIRDNPTIWQYAKRAGYRTVFIDAQAGVNKNPGLLQNFMSPREKADIDGFYAITDVDSAHADYRLIDIVAEELKRPVPVFIYANKNGAHFPYDRAYPAEEALYRPTITEAGAATIESHIASYRNAVSWSVDRFMKALFEKADLSNAAMIYTSDHGQVLHPNKLSHCAVDNPDPRMGLVPLMAYTDQPAWRAKFEAGARLNYGKASHFQIAPVLFALMGYDAADITTEYDETLFTETPRGPAFTSGDIFGLFTSDINWTPVDTQNIRIEAEALSLLRQAKTP